VPWSSRNDISVLLEQLRTDGFRLVALEQDKRSVLLPEYSPPAKIALLIGREVEGIDPELLALTDDILEIPMFGSKESFNVVQAAAMTLYHLRFTK
jgi:tRNA G18 (ribose-2'-O)-methylase SpoU